MLHEPYCNYIVMIFPPVVDPANVAVTLLQHDCPQQSHHNCSSIPWCWGNGSESRKMCAMLRWPWGSDLGFPWDSHGFRVFKASVGLWLVGGDWNHGFLLLSIYYCRNNHPNWRTPWFFRGVAQPPTRWVGGLPLKYWEDHNPWGIRNHERGTGTY